MRPRLLKDAQGRATHELLERDELESMYREHLVDLLDKLRKGLKQLMTDRLGEWVGGGGARGRPEGRGERKCNGAFEAMYRDDLVESNG